MTDHPLIYNKLVRDLIPEQITRSGKHASIGTLNTEQFLQALRLKLLEEAHELFHADTRADIINEAAEKIDALYRSIITAGTYKASSMPSPL